MTHTCIVVPCFNEERRLDSRAYSRFARSEPDVQFLFVDDGSTDGTATRLQSLVDSRPEQFNLLRSTTNRGKAEAVRQGLLAATASDAAYIGYWDADLATPLEIIPAFASVLDRMPVLQLVMGSRVQLLGRRIERRSTRHYLGRVFATAASLVLGLRVYDTQCGAKLFRAGADTTALFRTPFRSRWIFDVEILARMVEQWSGRGAPDDCATIYEYPLDAWCDVGGSKLKATDFLVAVTDLMRVRHQLRRLRGRADAPVRSGASQHRREVRSTT